VGNLKTCQLQSRYFRGRPKSSEDIIGSESNFKYTNTFIVGIGTKYRVFLEQPTLATSTVRKTSKWVKMLPAVNRSLQ
jgi:hypothetical protein